MNWIETIGGLIGDLGILFETVTGRPPGVTYSAYKSSYSGRFVEFVRIVFGALGRQINGRQVYRLLNSIRHESGAK